MRSSLISLEIVTVIVIGIISVHVYLVSKPNYDAEAVCTQKGGYLVRTYSGIICTKLEVIK